MATCLSAWLRALALLLAITVPLSAAELNNSSTGQWSEVDSSNTSASPDGWPTGLAPNQVRPVGQSMMGAIKRFWDRINATVTTSGSVNAYVYAPTSTLYPTAYVSGECFSWKANFTNTGSATLNVTVNGVGLGTKNIFKQTVSGPAALTGSEIQNTQVVTTCYDGTQFQIISAANLGGYRLTTQNTATGTDANTNEKTLQTYTLPANTLVAVGQKVVITATGTVAGTATTKQIKLKWGSATILDGGAIVLNGGAWYFTATLTKSAANAQQMGGYGLANTTVLGVGGGTQFQTDTSTIAIALTGQNGTANANDIVCLQMTVDFFN